MARPAAGDPLDARHLGPAVLERYVREHGLRPDRRFSQNFLADGEVLEALVAAADVAPGRRILEIGPGPGILTGALLAAGADVTAVEVDRRMVAHLRERFGEAGAPPGGDLAEGHLRVIAGDALDTDLAALMTAPWDLVANLPYHITSPTLHHVLGAEPRPARFVLMLQREVAERIAAPPGGLSYLSVFVQYHAHVRVARLVPAAAFEPAPEVESALLVGVTRPRRLEAAREEDLWRLVQAGFRERRKMLQNVLPRQLPAIERATLVRALAGVGIAPDRRPQTLAVEDWLALAAALGPLP
ncbi:MAG TPA: 16S rRNA (adenine(1518)-N(6)/adenine(1519)-N(6))-dimethyltransferase RsmA [Candidatus Sulfotelmatobacter sp.]|nr:16S rRNA (adenine(1518)-N(6)/adenine(1519)-N(6))-dimethyltransferase RsmA [Candidatus Sulfotelmatobacter sp.]